MENEEIRVESVKRRNPNEASPANIIPRTVQSNIQSIKVPSFPSEEFVNVNRLEDNVREETQVESMKFPTSDKVDDDQELPHDHPHTAVCQLLYIHSQNSRVEFHSSVKLVENWVILKNHTRIWYKIIAYLFSLELIVSPQPRDKDPPPSSSTWP